MERRVSKLVRTHEQQFKEEVKSWIMNNMAEHPSSSSLIQFVYDFPNVQLNADDFVRRKRVKNTVPVCDRCIANRANGERCTRRKRNGSNLCGTHLKGTPHGMVNETSDETPMKTVELWLKSINGITYHVDEGNRVYSPEDILKGSHTPRIIGELKIDHSGKEMISLF